MSGAMKILEEQISVSQAEDNNVTAFGKLGVEPIEQSDDVLLEVLRLRSANTASTDIVSNQLDKKYHRMVRCLITMQSLDISPTIS